MCISWTTVLFTICRILLEIRALVFVVLVDRSFNVSRGASSDSTALAIVLLALNYILSRWTRAVVAGAHSSLCSKQ